LPSQNRVPSKQSCLPSLCLTNAMRHTGRWYAATHRCNPTHLHCPHDADIASAASDSKGSTAQNIKASPWVWPMTFRPPSSSTVLPPHNSSLSGRPCCLPLHHGPTHRNAALPIYQPPHPTHN
jgi:hypothetical protein